MKCKVMGGGLGREQGHPEKPGFLLRAAGSHQKNLSKGLTGASLEGTNSLAGPQACGVLHLTEECC